MLFRALQSCLLLMLLPAAAMAANERAKAPGGFSYHTSIGETFSYNSNPLRSANNRDTLFGSSTSPRLVLRKKTPRSVMEADTTVEQNLFNHSEYNSTDLHHRLLLGTENAHWIANMRGIADIETTRTSELTSYALNLPSVTRTKLGVAPELTYKSTPEDYLTLRATAAHIGYDNNAYSDYDTYAVSPTYTRKLDAFHDLNLTFNASRYETTSGASLRSDSYGPMIGFTTRHSSKLTTKLAAGTEKTRKHGSNAGSKGNDWNYVFSADADYRTDSDRLRLRATRAREPFGNGTETLLTQFRAEERHRINPNLAATVNAGYQTADYTTEPGVNLDHAYQAGTGLSYQLARGVDLTTDYRFLNEALTHTGGTVNQHIVMLGIRYSPGESEDER